MNREITQWLQKDRKYQTGLALYLKYGKNKHLKTIFAKKESRANAEKLKYELSKLLSSQKPDSGHKKAIIKKAISKSANNVKKIADKAKKLTQNAKKPAKKDLESFPARYSELKVDPEVDFKTLPELLKREVHQRIALYKEANIHHQRLVLGGLTNDQIKESIDIILKNMETVDALWSRLDYYKEHGLVPPKPENRSYDKNNAFELSERLKNQVRPQISKLKKKLATSNDKNRSQFWKEQLGKLELEKNDIELRLAGA